jgi:predicted nucleic acid-binding protein
MRYVLDASVALCWVIPRPLSPKAVLLRDQYRRQIHELIAPSVYPHEIANALTKAERQKLIPVGDARPLSRDVLSSSPILHGTGLIFSRAIDISSQTRTGFYDCLYVALAEREGIELVTTDDKLLKNLHTRFPFVISLANLP